LLAALGCASAPTPHPAHSVIDMHAHVVFDPAAAAAMNPQRPPTPENVRACLDDPRLARLGAIVIAMPGDPAAAAAQNDALFALAQQNPRIFPIPSVHPADGEAASSELARVRGLGARMIKLHQNSQGFDLADPAVAKVVARAGELGLAVLLEGTAVLDPGTFGKVLMLAAKNPSARLVLAHMGFADFHQMLLFKQMESYGWWKRNVYFDLSATVARFARSPRAEELVWTIRQLGVDRVMFGTDFPVESFDSTLDAFDTLPFSPEERRAILHDTAAELLGL
jgi:hypothetical protein